MYFSCESDSQGLLLVGDGYVEEGGGDEARGVGAREGARRVAHGVFYRLVAQYPVYF